MRTEAVRPTAATFGGRNVLSGVLLGLGIAAFLDEVLFHQLLHWHHFYDKSTPAIGLISDGVFHAFSWSPPVPALFLFAALRRRDAVSPPHWWGGLLIGAGGFQLYDGTVQHKLMRLHQIRYHVTLWPYDAAWNAIAVLALALGVLLLLVRAGRTEAARERAAR